MIKPNSNHILQAQFDNVETCEKLVKFYSSQHQKCKSVQSNRTVHMHWSNCVCTGWSARCSCSLRRFYSCSGSCDNHAMVQSHMRGMIITRYPENLSVGASRAEQTMHTLVRLFLWAVWFDFLLFAMSHLHLLNSYLYFSEQLQCLV